MKLEEKNLIVKRAYKSVYKCDDCIVKVFNEGHPKSDVFNEALNTARVEETGLDIPKVKEVTQIDGKWSIAIEYKAGKTLEDMMESDMKNLEKYMEETRPDIVVVMYNPKAITAPVGYHADLFDFQ